MNANIPKATRDQSMFWGHDLAFWDWWGIRLMFGGAILGTAALLVSLASAYVLYRVADIAQANLLSTTKGLGVEIETQKSRAAEFEAQTEKLKAANLALEAQIQPRRLTGEDSRKISGVLATFPQPAAVAIVSRLLDAEGADFGDDLASAINDANWKTEKYRNWTRSDKGVFIATLEGTSLPLSGGALKAALDAANIKFKIISINAADDHTMSPPFQPMILYLLVGAKP
jgi:hypothetical protein